MGICQKDRSQLSGAHTGQIWDNLTSNSDSGRLSKIRINKQKKCLSWIVSPQNIFICWNPNPRYLRMWPHWEMGVFAEIIKLKWGFIRAALIECDWYPHKTWKPEHRGTHAQRENNVKTLREGMAIYKSRRDIQNRSYIHSPQKEPALTLISYF